METCSLGLNFQQETLLKFRLSRVQEFQEFNSQNTLLRAFSWDFGSFRLSMLALLQQQNLKVWVTGLSLLMCCPPLSLLHQEKKQPKPKKSNPKYYTPYSPLVSVLPHGWFCCWIPMTIKGTFLCTSYAQNKCSCCLLTSQVDGKYHLKFQKSSQPSTLNIF